MNIEISPYNSLLVYKQGYSLDFVRTTIRERNLKGLRIFTLLKDNRLNDLDFLSEYTFLEALDITSADDYNFSFLHKLQNLKLFSLNVRGNSVIDLSNQQKLEYLSINWRKGKILGLDKCQNIDKMCLVEYKENDFLPFYPLKKIKELIIKTASVKNLNGLENFRFLRSLTLGNCRQLRTINELEILEELRQITIDSCSKIEDYMPIGSLKKLESLEITDSKDVNTIKFMTELSLLKKLSLLGNTNVVDGDMMPAKNIEEVIYEHRKHYNFKIENKENDALIERNLKKINELKSR